MLIISKNKLQLLPGMAEFHPAMHKSLKEVMNKVAKLYFLKLLKVDKLDVKSVNDPRVHSATMTGLVRLAQAESTLTKEAITMCKKFGRVLGTNPLYKLTPRIDEQEVLRMTTRLDLAKDLDFDARCPVILCKEHPLVKLLILDQHERIHHSGGVQHTLAELQKRFWIPQAVSYVRAVLSKCEICQNLNAQVLHQKMAPLPLHRIPHPSERIDTFYTCGIDCAGPFLTVQGRGKPREKRYMLLFTCTMYRAVHIEMLKAMDTPCFLMAFTRFLHAETGQGLLSLIMVRTL